MGKRDTLRIVYLRPLLGGARFRLETYATPARDWRGQTTIGYVLSRHENGKREILFSGEDFHGSPCCADDSDETLGCLFGFLTLRPGDTDSEYFERYTDRQREWCSSFECEALGFEAMARFDPEAFR